MTDVPTRSTQEKAENPINHQMSLGKLDDGLYIPPGLSNTVRD